MIPVEGPGGGGMHSSGALIPAWKARVDVAQDPDPSTWGQVEGVLGLGALILVYGSGQKWLGTMIPAHRARQRWHGALIPVCGGGAGHWVQNLPCRI